MEKVHPSFHRSHKRIERCSPRPKEKTRSYGTLSSVGFKVFGSLVEKSTVVSNCRHFIWTYYRADELDFSPFARLKQRCFRRIVSNGQSNEYKRLCTRFQSQFTGLHVGQFRFWRSNARSGHRRAQPAEISDGRGADGSLTASENSFVTEGSSRSKPTTWAPPRAASWAHHSAIASEVEHRRGLLRRSKYVGRHGVSRSNRSSRQSGNPYRHRALTILSSAVQG